MAIRQLDLKDSKNVKSAAYDPDTQRLYISFATSSGYYDSVDEQEALDFERADSHGQYVHQYLKPVYTWVRL